MDSPTVKEEPNDTVKEEKKVEEEEEYNPFALHITDDVDRIYLRLYDRKYMHYSKIAETRTAFQLALRYFRDANPTLGGVFEDLLSDDDIILIEGEKDDLDPIHLLFAGNCIPHSVVNCTQIPFLSFRSNQQILIISTDCSGLSPEGKQKLVDFVCVGGTILSYNKAISVIDTCFPNLISYKHGETTLDKRVTLEVPESDDKGLFMGLLSANERNKATRFAGARRISVKDEDKVEVLVRELEPDQLPLALKISYQQGQVFHILPVGTDEILELRSKDKAKEYLKRVDGLKHIGEATKSAWKTAFSCSLHNSFYFAISVLPLLDVIFGIIKKYKH